MNISSPGWGKHAWSNFFAPFLAQATVFVYTYDRFDAATLMHVMDTHDVTTFCAPPTVWRMLIQADLSLLTKPPRELLGAGEPLNPEVISRVRAAWGPTIRDGYGQTEMTCAIGNSPGQVVKDGSMGRPLPGYPVVLVDPETGERGVEEGEICLDVSTPILGLMDGYHDAPERTARALHDGLYHTGDIASRDQDGYLSYVGRSDDVFKASDYKISPFELESVLLEHPAVAEAAVVPSPDPLRLAVPKAFVRLSAAAAADPPRRRARSSRTPAPASPPTSACAGSSSWRSFRRRSRERSAASSCVRRKPQRANGLRASSATATSAEATAQISTAQISMSTATRSARIVPM